MNSPSLIWLKPPLKETVSREQRYNPRIYFASRGRWLLNILIVDYSPVWQPTFVKKRSRKFVNYCYRVNWSFQNHWAQPLHKNRYLFGCKFIFSWKKINIYFLESRFPKGCLRRCNFNSFIFCPDPSLSEAWDSTSALPYSNFSPTKHSFNWRGNRVTQLHSIIINNKCFSKTEVAFIGEQLSTLNQSFEFSEEKLMKKPE